MSYSIVIVYFRYNFTSINHYICGAYMLLFFQTVHRHGLFRVLGVVWSLFFVFLESISDLHKHIQEIFTCHLTTEKSVLVEKLYRYIYILYNVYKLVL